MSRTNIVLDSQLVEEGLKVTGLKTKRNLIDYALRELLRHEKQAKLLELQGTMVWDGDLDQMRAGRVF